MSAWLTMRSVVWAIVGTASDAHMARARAARVHKPRMSSSSCFADCRCCVRIEAMSMPTVFVSHGSPTLILENLPARDFLASLGSLLPRPKAIVAVSAHWNTERPAVSTAEKPETIHVFYGFPDDLYRLHYDAPGAPALAERVAKLTGAVCDPTYGLDHGAWVPAMLGWPEANIPIFQLA